MCKRGCLANKSCNNEYVEEPKEPVSLRKKRRVDYTKRCEKEFIIERKDAFVTHRNLSLLSKTVTDLAKAYG